MATLPAVAFAIVLALSALLAAIAARGASGAVKIQIDIAALLIALLAVAQVCVRSLGSNAVNGITLLVLAVAPVALALAVAASRMRVSGHIAAAALLFAALLGGLAVWAMHASIALLPLLASLSALLVLGLLRLRQSLREAVLIVVSTLAFAAAASAYLDAGPRALSLFLAAGVMGIALAVAPSRANAKEQRGRWTSRPLTVRRKR